VRVAVRVVVAVCCTSCPSSPLDLMCFVSLLEIPPPPRCWCRDASPPAVLCYDASQRRRPATRPSGLRRPPPRQRVTPGASSPPFSLPAATPRC
jgi:hypothetical protein